MTSDYRNMRWRHKTGKKRSRLILIFVLIISLATMFTGCCYLIQVRVNQRNAAALNAELRSLYHQNTSESEHDKDAFVSLITKLKNAVSLNAGVAFAESASEYAESFFMPIVEDVLLTKKTIQPEFVQLCERNADTVGWLTTGCGVDYPILWRDNDFYLNHDFDGNFSDSGAIFLDQRNNKEMTDDSLLIFGHNMRSGFMFGDLDDYRKLSEVAEEPFVRIRSAWEEKERTYVYFSLFDASMNKGDPSYVKITRFDFETPEEKLAYLNTLVERSMHDLPIDVNENDRIVCLVTCSYTHDNGRFLLFAREMREDESEDSILAQFKS